MRGIRDKLGERGKNMIKTHEKSFLMEKNRIREEYGVGFRRPYERNRPPQLPVFLSNLSLLRKPWISYFVNFEMNGGILICEGRHEPLSWFV